MSDHKPPESREQRMGIILIFVVIGAISSVILAFGRPMITTLFQNNAVFVLVGLACGAMIGFGAAFEIFVQAGWDELRGKYDEENRK
ncbi:MAG: hypothetical protein HRU11_11990 [Parvularculaceae bacterium]|nr:hypothetical protein [Parvularculaceae bacterium]